MMTRNRIIQALCLLSLVVCLLPACDVTGTLPTFVPTLTPSSTPTNTPTVTPTFTPVPATPTPTPTPTATPTPTLTPTPTPPPLTGVLIVSIDGLRPDAIQLADTPNLDWLISRGAISWQAQTILPSATLPSHASMLSGTSPEVHEVRWNDYKPELGFIAVPTIFSVAHEAGLTTAMFVGKIKLQHLAAPGTVDSYIYVTGGDAQVANQAAHGMREVSPDVLFVHLPDVDTTGHVHGWLSSPQLDFVTLADAAVGMLLDTLDELGRLDSTLIVVTADHGGIGTTHGGNEPESMTIPWLIAGPGVRSGYELETEIVTYDTAVTVAWALGLPLSPKWEGRPVIEAFGE